MALNGARILMKLFSRLPDIYTKSYVAACAKEMARRDITCAPLNCGHWSRYYSDIQICAVACVLIRYDPEQSECSITRKDRMGANAAARAATDFGNYCSTDHSTILYISSQCSEDKEHLIK